MNYELKYLLTQTAQGKFSRRAFMGRAAAAGITAASASTLLASAAHAAGPQKGGTLKMGMGGGQGGKVNLGAMENALNQNLKRAEMKERMFKKGEQRRQEQELEKQRLAHLASLPKPPPLTEAELEQLVFSIEGEKQEKSMRGVGGENKSNKKKKKKGKKK